jgi:hypothetical protein
LGAVDGASKDAVHLLAAEAVAVDMAGFTPIPAGDLAQGTFDAGAFAVEAGQGTLAFGAAIEVGAPGDVVTLVADYTANADANVAAVLFDGGIDPNSLAYTNPSAPNIAVDGSVKSISMSMVTATGTVVPAIQVASKGGAASVSISNLAVVKAGPVTDYALNKGATAYESDLADIAGWNPLDGAAPTQGDGTMVLGGVAGLSNALMTVDLPQGTSVAECYAKKTAGEGAFAIALTDGGALSAVTFTGNLGDDFSKVIAVGTLSNAGGAFLVVQAAPGIDAEVDDITVRIVDEPAGSADLSLLGM